MGARRYRLPFWSMLLPALLVLLLATPQSVHGDEPQPKATQGTCVSCHTDLYFLHDTGKWFCLRESPMSCADCHEGDPTSLVKQDAHADRSAHPVFNGDSQKCLECHPAQQVERVQIFRKVAGVKPVIVHAEYVPPASVPLESSPSQPQTGRQLALTLLGVGLVAVLIAAYIRSNPAKH